MKAPVVEQVRYRTADGELAATLYRPPGGGPHPGILLCLGVVPFGVDHPQVPRLCEALTRAGFVTLIHWSPAMRDRRLVPEDVANIARAYEFLLERDDVDARRSGLFGTCVGGSFALLAAAHPLIRDEVSFVGAFAPYSSLWTLTRDVASRTREAREGTRPWDVDPLTREVFERTLHQLLTPNEAAHILGGRARDAVAGALKELPSAARESLDRMSPILHLADIRAARIVVGHDRDDNVIPIEESRHLARALAGRKGVTFTEYAMFQHADPMSRRLSPFALCRELLRFYRSLYPLFELSA
jgi:dipeptidyl aminopeptidase/acylaminoacyl peptidase